MYELEDQKAFLGIRTYAEYTHVSMYLLICANNPVLEGQNHF